VKTALQAASALTARTVAVDGRDVDLLAFAGDDGVVFMREGAGLAGRGAALRVAPSAVDEALAAIECEDEVGLPGAGPVAIGALPFRPGAPGELVIPQTVLGRSTNGTAWMTTIGDGAPPRPAPAPDRRPPDGFTLTSPRSHDDWRALVAEAVEVVRSGQLHKVVLAREVLVEANRPILPVDVLGRLRALYPSCMVFSVDGFVGASPELLVSRFGVEVRSHPLAGTIPRSGDPAMDERLSAELLASAKDRVEHRIVVEDVAAALRPWCDSLDVPDTPAIVPLRNVSHLGTKLSGRLAEGAPSALALALLLHPTPAVAGTPTDAALALIDKVEGFDRGRFAGPVGWVDARGDGDWAVGIRSAELDGNRARLIAGVGIVADSTPDAELAETQLKLQALLAAVVRP
jgi:menaquinone-specific isochorismate synthase